MQEQTKAFKNPNYRSGHGHSDPSLWELPSTFVNNAHLFLGMLALTFVYTDEREEYRNISLEHRWL